MIAEGNAYHPDPVRTGSARIDDAPCVLCGRTETAKYEGPAVLDDAEVDEEQICIACINSGTAHDRLGAIFTQHFSDEDGWAEVALLIGFGSSQSLLSWSGCDGADLISLVYGPEEPYVAYLFNGYESEYSGTGAIPMEQAREAVRVFATGDRPTTASDSRVVLRQLVERLSRSSWNLWWRSPA